MTSTATTNPLSAAQARMWLAQRVEPDDPGWNMGFGWRLHGALDLAALRLGVQKVLQRHEVLRRRFVDVDGVPQTVLEQDPTVPWSEHDVSAGGATMSDELPSARTTRLLQDAVETVFDLADGPPVRVLLIHEAPTTCVLYVVVHHIVFDGQSQDVFARDLSRFYAEAVGDGEPVEPLAASYADYVCSERDDPFRDEALEYWTGVLRGMEPAQLPTDFRITPTARSASTQRYDVGRGTWDALEALAARQHSTGFMVALGALQITLARFTGASDVIIGTPIETRDRAELDDTIGLFFNPLPITGTVRPDNSVDTQLRDVRDALLGAFQHASAPFNDIVAAFNPTRHRDGPSVLWQSWMEIERTTEVESLVLPNVEVTGIVVGEPALRSDLDVSLEVQPAELVVRVTYRSDKFRSESIERIATRFVEVLRSIAREDCSVVGDLGRLDPLQDPELRRLCVGTDVDAPHDLLRDVFEGPGARDPERVAVAQGDRAMSYRELLDISRGVAESLLERGAGPEDVVAVWMERQPAMLPAMLGAMLAGCAYLPLDPDLPSDRLSAVVEDARPCIALIAGSGQVVPPWAEHVVDVLQQSCSDVEVGRFPGLGVAADHLAYLIYTSGSTGKPKGVMVERGGLGNFVRWCAEGYDSGQGNGAPVFSSISFDAVLPNLFGPLVLGETVHMLPVETDLSDLGPTLARGGPYNFVKLTPQHLDVLASQLTAEEASALCGRLVVGADRFARTTLDRWRALDPHTPILNEYGPTEITVANSTYAVDRAPDVDVLPIGRPIPGTSMWILDDTLRPVPPGGVGEICVGGRGVARGYRGRPETTASVFLPDPLSTIEGARIYRTGDYGRVGPDGDVEFLGRRDHQIKIRGYRIEPAEIEQALTAQHELSAAHVTGWTSPDGRAELVAYVVEATPVEDRELRRRLREKLSQHQVPTWIYRLPEIPLNKNGKVDPAGLPTPASTDGAPTPDSPAWSVPGNGAPTQLQQIWAEVLGLEDVGRNDNFFELGGYSMSALTLIARVEERIGKRLTMREVFAAPTVEEMTGVLAEKTPLTGESPVSPPSDTEQAHALSTRQQQLLFAQQADGSSTAYNLVAGWTISGPVDLDILERALRELAQRHPALRTRIEMREGSFVQVAAPVAETEIGRVDVRSENVEHARQRVRTICDDLDRRPFALGSPLTQLLVVETAPQECVFLVAGHHLTADGWSMGLIIRDLGELYSALLEARDDVLPTLPTDVAALLARDETVPHEEDTHLPAPVNLPTDHPRSSAQTAAGASVRGLLPASSWSAVQAVARGRRVTPFAVLLAALQVVVAEFASKQHFSFGFSDAGRDDPRVHNIVGLFFKQSVGVCDLRDDPTLAELVDRTSEGLVSSLGGGAMRGTGSAKTAQSLWVELEPEGDAESSFPDSMNVTEFELPVSAVKNDLVVSMQATAEGVKLSLAYRLSLFKEETVIALRDRFVDVATEIGDLLDRPFSELSAASARRRASNAPPGLDDVADPCHSRPVEGGGGRAGLLPLASEVLGGLAVGPSDNFFDLGGDSIKAVSLVARAHEKQIDLTVRELVESATFADLIGASPSSSATSIAAPTGHRGLVEVREAQDGRQLVCIQPSGGTVPWYFTLARSLPDGCGLSAFLAWEDTWLGSDRITVEDMAKALADELCEEPQAGPVTLLGWSASGVWALETARALRARGVAVEPLVLVEPALPNVVGRAGIRRAWADFDTAADLVDAVNDETCPDPERSSLRERLRDLVDDSPVLADSVPELTSSGPLRMSAAMEMAQLSYVPQPYDGSAILLVSDEVMGSSAEHPSRVADVSAPSYLDRWRRLFPTLSLDIGLVSGDHISMLQDDENARQIAGRIARLWGLDR